VIAANEIARSDAVARSWLDRRLAMEFSSDTIFIRSDVSGSESGSTFGVTLGGLSVSGTETTRLIQHHGIVLTSRKIKTTDGLVSKETGMLQSSIETTTTWI
jgi:hypothetical protein